MMRCFRVSALAMSAVLLLFVAHGHGFTSRTAAAQTLSDREILEALYDATDGPNWASENPETSRPSWKVAADLGDWHGVTTDTDGRVTRLNLADNNLAGEIPPELGRLTSLTNLSLSFNRKLSGPIPPELGGLTDLVALSIRAANLTGEIPPELGTLASLGYLDLDSNRLTGPIPSELGDLTSLVELGLQNNDLTGEIPSELGRLSNLTILSLDGNQLTGPIPRELGDLASLELLYLEQNRLTGPIPSELGDLASLLRLRLDDNRLSGSIPSQLGGISSLQWLILSGNELSGPIPPELGDLTGLTALYLSDNQLSGEIPRELGDITGLFALYLNDNRLSGEIPSELGDRASLQWLLLHNNELTGELPDLNSLTSLTRLGLGGNDLDISWSTFGTGGNLDLESRTNLTHLWLHDSGLQGSIPTWLANHASLERLYLEDNDLTGELPDLDTLTGLTHLGLGGNGLDISWSTFESEDHLDLSARANLIVLYLHDLGLEGEIPSWLGNHAGMERLRLHGNDLTGGWEEALKPMTKLLELTMSRGAVSGSGLLVWLFGLPNFLIVPDGAPPAGSDRIESKVTWTHATIDLADVYVPSHPRIARAEEIVEESAVDISISHRDADGEPLDGALIAPAVVCVPVSSAHSGRELRLLKEEGSVWRYLEPVDPPSGYDPGDGRIAVCGATVSFSQFVPAVVELVAGSSAAGGAARISRIEPSIRSATVSAGGEVRLSFDVYGRQDILDNDLADGHAFAWDDGGAGGSFKSSDRSNTIIYTAPAASGKHTLTTTSPAGACLGGEDFDERCSAKYTITVRRPSAAPEERRLAPKNPTGEIPSVLVDAEGRQYEVLTPEEGGGFDGGDAVLSSDAGVVPNGEIVGVRIDAGDSASNIGKSHHRYSLAGQWYDVIAVDADGAPVSGYSLRAPLRVCLPLPPELRSSIADVAVVSANADDSLTVLAASIRFDGASTSVCANLSELPATVAAGRRGSPADLPTPVPDPEEIETPDTGGAAPPIGALTALLIAGGASAVAGASLAARLRRRRSRPPQFDGPISQSR